MMESSRKREERNILDWLIFPRHLFSSFFLFQLLGLESKDIDFALDNMSGEEFAGKLGEYMKASGLKMSSVGVIKVNPDQSKHLATATMKIMDVSVDINNFRQEIYHSGS